MEFTAKFTFDKETKNTVRFQESPEAGQPPKIGMLYIQKWAVGDAKEVTVTVRHDSPATAKVQSVIA